MQIMPATAEEAAGDLGLPTPTAEDLFDTDLNVKLGTYYLAEMIDRFDGDLHLALAAYNAGPTKVSSWQRQAPEAAGDEVVRRRAYRSTGAYVDQVLRAWRRSA